MRTYVNQIKKNYDYIFIDCTPSLGLLPINAFVAADSIIVPSQPRILSTKGLDLLLRTYSQVKRGINPDLKIDGILFTMVDSRTVNDRSVIESMRETFGMKINVFDTFIPASVRVTEANMEGKSIFAYRAYRDGVTDEQIEDLKEKLYCGEVTEKDIEKVTRRLGDEIGSVYGWTFPGEKPKVKVYER